MRPQLTPLLEREVAILLAGGQRSAACRLVKDRLGVGMFQAIDAANVIRKAMERGDLVLSPIERDAAATLRGEPVHPMCRCEEPHE